MRVAVVGGTGDFGLALAAVLAAAGEDVVVGSRDEARARAAAEPVSASGATNEDAVAGADLVVLAVKADAALDTATALAERDVACVAVSPLIGGRAVKGPADRMLARMAGGTSPAHVTDCYKGLIDAIVVDEADSDDLDGLGDVRPIVALTLMSDADARRRLVEAALAVPA